MYFFRRLSPHRGRVVVQSPGEPVQSFLLGYKRGVGEAARSWQIHKRVVMGEELDKITNEIREIGMRVAPIYEVRRSGGAGRIHKGVVAVD